MLTVTDMPEMVVRFFEPENPTPSWRRATPVLVGRYNGEASKTCACTFG